MQLKKLREVRRERGLSQRELGERIGVLQARISSIESGTSVTRATAERLAKALSVDTGELVELDEPMVQIPLRSVTPEILALLTKSR